MDEIRQWQEQFRDVVLSSDNGKTLRGLSGCIPPQVSTAIYRNNILEGFRLALADIYRTTEQLLGEECFRALCHEYVQNHPSVSGDRNAYGQELSSWLAGHPLAHTIPYLPDLARLEWRQHEAYLAEDGFSALGLHNSVRLVESDYPIFSIWAFCQDPENAGTLDLDHLSAESILVARPTEEVLMRPVGPAEALWYGSLLSGHGIQEARQMTIATEPDFDLATLVQNAVAEGLIRESH
ncbi:MAG: DNA-binding domain-containing protein [Acidithiobacillus sp.]|nr:DNA-binding domain-containing protein [Acidithiobacillus sp.]